MRTGDCPKIQGVGFHPALVSTAVGSQGKRGRAVSFQNFLSPEGSVAADRFTIMERLFSLILDSG